MTAVDVRVRVRSGTAAPGGGLPSARGLLIRPWCAPEPDLQLPLPRADIPAATRPPLGRRGRAFRPAAGVLAGATPTIPASAVSSTSTLPGTHQPAAGTGAALARPQVGCYWPAAGGRAGLGGAVFVRCPPVTRSGRRRPAAGGPL